MLDGNRDSFSYAGLQAAQQIRWDFLRTGAAIGGVGEGIWAAGTCEMKIDGTPAVTFNFGPVRYAVGPPEVDPQSWVVTRFHLFFRHVTAPLIAGFGSGNALANGCLIRINRPNPPDGGAGETTTLANVQTNADFHLVGDVNREDDGVNAYSVATWASRAMVLHGRYNDTLQVLIRDDLSGYAGTMHARCDAYVISG